MIRVECDFDKVNNKISLNMYGHAGYAEYGKDLVCASASILAYTLASNLPEEADVELREGRAFMSANADINAISAFKVIMVGFKLLEKQYPDNVSIKFGESTETLE